MGKNQKREPETESYKTENKNNKLENNHDDNDKKNNNYNNNNKNNNHKINNHYQVYKQGFKNFFIFLKTWLIYKNDWAFR